MNQESQEQALRAIQVAKAALQQGDKEKAIRFLKKSLNIYKTREAEMLLSQIENESASSSENNDNKQEHHGHHHHHHHAQHHHANNSGHSSPRKRKISHDSKERNFTPEQQAEAKRIKNMKDYYQILGIEKNASDKEIKAAYRKMALKFHPDKNQAPEAEDAFKSVSQAFQCLSDPQKRTYYDEHGEEDHQRQQREAAEYARANQFYEEELTPEDLFNMFFGAGQFPQGRTHRTFHFRNRPQRRQQQQDADQHGSFKLLQFLPLFLLMIFSYLNSPSASEDTPFSLDRTSTYSVLRHTPKTQLPYYVTPSFSSRYTRDPRSLYQVEVKVEEFTFRKYEEDCNREDSEQKRVIQKAQRAKSPQKEELLKQAHDMPLNSCKKLNDLRNKILRTT